MHILAPLKTISGKLAFDDKLLIIAYNAKINCNRN
nr:MAG TPA: hypothetical protein [Caudoviricetes sp.]